MSKNKSQANKKKDEISLTRKQYNIALFSVVISIIGVLLSVVLSGSSLLIANEANSIAHDANNISLTTLKHQNIIEESNLQIGTPQSLNYHDSSNNLNKYSIRIPLINGYYARYPALILSTQGILNGKSIKLTEIPRIETNATQYPKNFKFVERGQPTFIDIVFDESSDFDVSNDDMLHTIKQVTSKGNLVEGDNELIIYVHYLDFSKMITWTINSTIHFTFSDGEMISDINLAYVERDKIKEIQ